MILAYYIIRDGSAYQEAGGDIYDRRNPERTAKRLARRLERIGFEVHYKARASVPPKPAPPVGQSCSRCSIYLHLSRRHPEKTISPLEYLSVSGVGETNRFYHRPRQK
ncbi:MAG: hypothetical protein ABSG79_24520 [Bryobacteraceae bacterium]